MHFEYRVPCFLVFLVLVKLVALFLFREHGLNIQLLAPWIQGLDIHPIALGKQGLAIQPIAPGI